MSKKPIFGDFIWTAPNILDILIDYIRENTGPIFSDS